MFEIIKITQDKKAVIYGDKQRHIDDKVILVGDVSTPSQSRTEMEPSRLASALDERQWTTLIGFVRAHNIAPTTQVAHNAFVNADELLAAVHNLFVARDAKKDEQAGTCDLTLAMAEA